MPFTIIIRRWLFWILDTMKGNRVRNHLRDIEHSFSFTSFDQLQHKNSRILQTLLTKVTEQSTYYKKYVNFSSLKDFPIVNKTIIKDNFTQINIFDKDQPGLIKVSTSGSTGSPFSIYQNKNKKARNTADTLFFARTSGFKIGYKLLYLRLWSAYYKKSSLLAAAQNIVQVDVEELTDTYLKKFLDKLQKDKSPKAWLGYPSGFSKICKYLKKTDSEPLNANIRSIIAMSEPLGKGVKKQMEYYFKCPVVSRYSNIENGIIAQQYPNQEKFTINWASYYVEILDLKSDMPVMPGEIGRIVVTDLYTLATPMIRYDTGDVGSFVNDERGFPCFNIVNGRITDVLRNTGGDILNPFIFYNNLYRFPEIDQIQLVQLQKKKYEFRIKSKGKFERENEFISFFRNYLGNDAVISTKYVDDIPLLKSGKKKLIVSKLS